MRHVALNADFHRHSQADTLAQIGVRFVPIPVETDEEFHTLAASLSQKLEMMVAKAEADERDQV
ncbi:DUF1382 family protein [Escherichia coli]|nr:DUF1382 family protein [Escherichia coli]